MKYATLVRVTSIGIAVVLLGGCAFGQKITYSNTTADIEASGNTSVAVGTHDQRPYVLTTRKSPAFVGLSRGGYGNPFDVETPSGAPLSDEISESVSRSLADRGFKTSVVKVTPGQSGHSVIEAMTASGAERLVLITLREWKSDKFIRTSMIEDVTVKVLDSAGNELARASFHSDEVVGDVPLAFRNSIEQWFSNPKIIAALK